VTSLKGVPADQRTILATHIAFQFVDGRGLGPPYDIQRDGLMGIAAQASNLQVAKIRVQGIAKCRRRLGGPLVAKHSVIPSLTGEAISYLARSNSALRRLSDRTAEEILARLCGHAAHQSAVRQSSQMTL
jgi:hypothetical protein